MEDYDYGSSSVDECAGRQFARDDDYAAPPPTKNPPTRCVSASVAPPNLKRRRNNPYTSCDRCKARKVRCDGQMPCSFCAVRDGQCTYSQRKDRENAKRAKTEAGAVVVHAPVEQEERLLTQHARQYYLDLFLRMINPMYKVFDGTLMSHCAEDNSQALEQSMAICFAARAIGHIGIAQQLMNQCRQHAGDVIDHFVAPAAVGFMLMSTYFMGEDNAKATHYASLAMSISKHSQPCWKTKQVASIVVSSRVLEGPNRKCHQARAISASETESREHSIVSVWRSPHSEMVLDVGRNFPVNSEYMDIWCHQKCVVRYPVHERTDEFLSLDRLEQCFALTLKGDDEVMTLKVPTDPQRMRRFTLVHGLRTYICAAGGLVDLGCMFARYTFKYLKSFPTEVMGFSRAQVMTSSLFIACFANMYKVHPFGDHLDYRSFLLDVAEIIRPLSTVFLTARNLLTLIERDARERYGGPAQFQPRDDQTEVGARLQTYYDRWLRGEGRTLPSASTFERERDRRAASVLSQPLRHNKHEDLEDMDEMPTMAEAMGLSPFSPAAANMLTAGAYGGNGVVPSSPPMSAYAEPYSFGAGAWMGEAVGTPESPLMRSTSASGSRDEDDDLLGGAQQSASSMNVAFEFMPSSSAGASAGYAGAAFNAGTAFGFDAGAPAWSAWDRGMLEPTGSDRGAILS